jgi:hypothetical protein
MQLVIFALLVFFSMKCNVVIPQVVLTLLEVVSTFRHLVHRPRD